MIHTCIMVAALAMTILAFSVLTDVIKLDKKRNNPEKEVNWCRETTFTVIPSQDFIYHLRFNYSDLRGNQHVMRGSYKLKYTVKDISPELAFPTQLRNTISLFAICFDAV